MCHSNLSSEETTVRKVGADSLQVLGLEIPPSPWATLLQDAPGLSGTAVCALGLAFDIVQNTASWSDDYVTLILLFPLSLFLFLSIIIC